MKDLQKRTWAEISLDNISHNYEVIRAALPSDCCFLGVVKADAYGHGALRVARLLQNKGADYLAVSCLDEALELRHRDLSCKGPGIFRRGFQDGSGAEDTYKAGHRHVPPGLSLRRGAF